MTDNEKTSLPAVVKFQVALAVLSTVVTIALVAYIPKLIERKAALDADILQLQKQKADLEKQTADLTAQRNAAQSAYNSLAVATSESLPPGQVQKAIEQSLSSNPEAAKILPRIFIHIRSTSQSAKARVIADTFRAQGFVVPKVQILPKEGPGETQVSYFHPADEEEAGKIAQSVSDAGGPKAITKLVSDLPNIRPRQYEIWFTANAL
jgi:FtsZ-binding cell division protein ZapB